MKLKSLFTLSFATIGLLTSCAKDEATPQNLATSISIDEFTGSPKTTTLTVGKTLTLTSTVLPEEASNKAVTYTSSDTKIATVGTDNSATITAIALGKTTITATTTDGSNRTDIIEITVVEPSTDAGLTDFLLDGIAIAADETKQITNTPKSWGTNGSVTPIITYNPAEGATITSIVPENPKISDFATTAGVTYTVIAEDGTTIKTYTYKIGVANYSDGTEAKPYGIYIAADLSEVRNGLDKNYKLMNDIALPDAGSDGVVAITGIEDYATAGWAPIGYDVNVYTGTFDGNGFIISNLWINRSILYAGLFGYTSGTIKNLGVNGKTTGTAITNNIGRFTAILAGYNKGTIEKCYATGNTYGSYSYLESSNSGILAGYNDEGTIENCYAIGDAVAIGDGFVIAGTIGNNTYGTIKNCYGVGNRTATSSTPSVAYAGGFVGYNSTTSGGGITNCYRNSDSVITKNGAVVADPSDKDVVGITAKTTAQMKSSDFATSLNAGSSIWGQDASKNDGFPYIIGVGVGK